MKKKQQRRYPQGVRFRLSCRTLLKVSFKYRTCVGTVTNLPASYIWLSRLSGVQAAVLFVTADIGLLSDGNSFSQ